MNTASRSRVVPGDPWGAGDRTVFGQDEPGLLYDYTNVLEQYDIERHWGASFVADTEERVRHTARWYQSYLSAYRGRQVEVRHVLIGVNRASGKLYRVIGYR